MTLSAQSRQQGPASAPPSNYKNILVGYDGSDNSGRALARAIYAAKRQGANLHILVVINTTLPIFSPISPTIPDSIYQEIVEDGKKTLSKAMDMAKGQLEGLSGSVEDGHAAEEILTYAAKNGVDLIVVGRRGVSGVERFLLGGVSSSVVNHSKCDVLVVK